MNAEARDRKRARSKSVDPSSSSGATGSGAPAAEPEAPAAGFHSTAAPPGGKSVPAPDAFRAGYPPLSVCAQQVQAYQWAKVHGNVYGGIAPPWWKSKDGGPVEGSIDARQAEEVRQLLCLI